MERLTYTIFVVQYKCDEEGKQIGIGKNLYKVKGFSRIEAEKELLGLSRQFKPKGLGKFVLITLAPAMSCITYADVKVIQLDSNSLTVTKFPENEKE